MWTRLRGPGKLAFMRLMALLVLVLASDCGPGCPTDGGHAMGGWTAADPLFRGDSSWRGGDSAYSVDLGSGRVLWLFGDSFVSLTGSGARAGAPLARNTLAIEHGYDPTAATIDFHYQRDSQGMPSAFFPADAPNTWFWPGPGARLGPLLLVFLWRVKSAPGDPLGFQNDLPEARIITNPDQEPTAWQVSPVAVPSNPWGVFLGTGAVLVKAGYLYSISCVEPGNHDVYAARWPIDKVTAGDLGDPEWATGDDSWTPQSLLAGAPLRLFGSGHTEFSVHFDTATSQYVQLQMSGFPGDLLMRTAPALTGPWSAPRDVYRPPDLDCSNVFTYAGKAHPELVTPAGRIAVTYASNSSDFSSLVRDLSLYFPRFIQLDVATATVVPVTAQSAAPPPAGYVQHGRAGKWPARATKASPLNAEQQRKDHPRLLLD